MTAFSGGFYVPSPQQRREDFAECKRRAKATAERLEREGVPAVSFSAHARDSKGYDELREVEKGWKIPGKPSHYIDPDGELYRIVTRPNGQQRIDYLYATMVETGGAAFQGLLNSLDQAAEVPVPH